jgi:hypothetical protein
MPGTCADTNPRGKLAKVRPFVFLPLSSELTFTRRMYSVFTSPARALPLRTSSRRPSFVARPPPHAARGVAKSPQCGIPRQCVDPVLSPSLEWAETNRISRSFDSLLARPIRAQYTSNFDVTSVQNRENFCRHFRRSPVHF